MHWKLHFGLRGGGDAMQPFDFRGAGGWGGISSCASLSSSLMLAAEKYTPKVGAAILKIMMLSGNFHRKIFFFMKLFCVCATFSGIAFIAFL